MPEGWSATFRVQGLGFYFYLFFNFFELKIRFLGVNFCTISCTISCKTTFFEPSRAFVLIFVFDVFACFLFFRCCLMLLIFLFPSFFDLLIIIIFYILFFHLFFFVFLIF